MSIDYDNLDSTYTYIAKKDTWYKEGTECKLEANCGWMGGLFRGTIHVTDGSHSKYLTNKLNGKEFIEFQDGELCEFDEFDIYKDGKLIEIKENK